MISAYQSVEQERNAAIQAISQVFKAMGVTNFWPVPSPMQQTTFGGWSTNGSNPTPAQQMAMWFNNPYQTFPNYGSTPMNKMLGYFLLAIIIQNKGQEDPNYYYSQAKANALLALDALQNPPPFNPWQNQVQYGVQSGILGPVASYTGNIVEDYQKTRTELQQLIIQLGKEYYFMMNDSLGMSSDTKISTLGFVLQTLMIGASGRGYEQAWWRAKALKDKAALSMIQ